jgi:UDP-glucose:(glucosyl)LPS alpha-1,3-glucosyltransferase
MNSTTPAAHQDGQVFHIAFCIDDRYCRAMGGAIGSVIAQNPAQRFKFHALAFSMDPAHQARLRRLEQMYPLVSSELHLLDQAALAPFANLLGHSHYSLSTFARLLMPAKLQGQTDRVLYMDADVLCTGKLDELIAMKLDDVTALVAPDATVTTRRRVAALELPRPEYFNAGVMLINIERWLAEDTLGAALHVLKTSTRDMRFLDQDALNIVLNDKVRYISSRWNYLYDLIRDLEVNRTALKDLSGASLVHFAGAVKPWADWTGHEVREVFRQGLEMTPWSDMPLDPEPVNTKEMRMQSRFLWSQHKPLQSLRWYIRYLRARSARR